MNTKTVVRITLAALSLSFAITPARAAFGTAGSVVPQLLDGISYRTVIYIQNLGPASENYQLNLLNSDGTPALFQFAELSGATGSLTGGLQPLGVAIFHTNGGAAITQVGWARLDYTGFPTNTGIDVSVWEVIESSDPITHVWTTQSLVVGIPMTISASIPAYVLFDNTGDYNCGVATVNLSPTTVYLTVDLFDANGVLLQSLPFTLLPYNQYEHVLSEESANTIGIAGTLRFHPTNSSDVLSLAIMGIKATKYAVGWTQTSLPVAYMGTVH